jgi:hypothetical protein
MSLANAFVGSDARYKAQVIAATWGHLEMKTNTLQKGWFVFSITAYSGHHVILGSDWGDVPDSPGLYEAMEDYIFRHGKRGVVMRLEGHIRRYKNGAYRIGGKRKIMKIKPTKDRRYEPNH